LLISSTTPATNTGNAAMNKTGHNQVNVILLGPKTNNPAKLPAQIASPPTRGAGLRWLAWGLSISVSPVSLPCQRSERTIIPPTTKATVAIDSQVTKSQVAEPCTIPPKKEDHPILSAANVTFPSPVQIQMQQKLLILLRHHQVLPSPRSKHITMFIPIAGTIVHRPNILNKPLYFGRQVLLLWIHRLNIVIRQRKLIEHSDQRTFF